MLRAYFVRSRFGDSEAASQEVGMKVTIITAAALLSLHCMSVRANDDEARYNQRAAQTDLSLFLAMDHGGKGRLDKNDTRGDLNLGPRFDDIDVNGDGIITLKEMQTYIKKTYGVQPVPG
jgi:hypothetical protein